MTTTAVTNPSFELPEEDSDNELWLLRAPAHLDVSALLNGVTLDVDNTIIDTSSSSSTSNTNTIFSRFKSGSSEYALTLGDANESDNVRLLVPDKKSSSNSLMMLIPHERPFQRQIHLTSVMASDNNNNNADNNNNNVQTTDLIVAPATENAPKPAFHQTGNGSVDMMRLAYVPVAQRSGLKRRWAMPGGKQTNNTTSNKKARTSSLVETPKKDAIVSDDDDHELQRQKQKEKGVKTASSKKAKKEKKKKEKKSKKSAKK